MDAVLVYWSHLELLELISRFFSVCVSTAASKQRHSLWRDAAMRGKSQSFRASKSIPSTFHLTPWRWRANKFIFRQNPSEHGPKAWLHCCVWVHQSHWWVPSHSPNAELWGTPPRSSFWKQWPLDLSWQPLPLHPVPASSDPIFTKPSILGSEKTRPPCLQPTAGGWERWPPYSPVLCQGAVGWDQASLRPWPLLFPCLFTPDCPLSSRLVPSVLFPPWWHFPLMPTKIWVPRQLSQPVTSLSFSLFLSHFPLHACIHLCGESLATRYWYGFSALWNKSSLDPWSQMGHNETSRVWGSVSGGRDALQVIVLPSFDVWRRR